MTKQREIVLDIVRKHHEHLTADEVYAYVVKENHKMVYATVYNCLNYLVDEGLIRRIKAPGKDRYDHNLTPHDHFICDECGIVHDIPSRDIPTKFVDENGNHIEKYEMIYHGICKKCYNNH